MTAAELQQWLRERFPRENERHEWKGWASLKSNVSGRKGQDLVCYVSALANMGGGAVVLGVADKTLAIIGIADVDDYTPENLPHRILGRTTGLDSMGLRVEVLTASDTGKTVWVLHVPGHAPRRAVTAHDKAWQRDGDSLVELRPDRLQAILREPLMDQDWSAQVVPGATLTDLDPGALVKAREQFTKRNANKPWALEIQFWSDTAFLDKAKLTINGQITRATLLLLGTAESAALLSPHVAEISWKLPSENAVEHFGPPWILNTTAVLQRVRNFNTKLYPNTRLLAEEVPKYETEVILEALHNCVAHQDYELCERIVVEERDGDLRFRNAGSFFEGQPDSYLGKEERTPGRYRNKFLATAMTSLGMIDEAGFGIRKMFQRQSRRFLPLPDYDLRSADHVVLKVYGQVIDPKYSQLLMDRTDLPLEHVLWLDRVQKKLSLTDEQAAELRRAGLIEGRRPNWIAAASVANATNTRAAYTRNKGLDDQHYKTLIVRHVRQFKEVSGREIRELILDKLPETLTKEQKEAKVKNLLTALRADAVDGVRLKAVGRGPGSRWIVDSGN
jgi:ATP-dependent DNA helicase RecG